MQIQIRVSGALGERLSRSRFATRMPDGATVADLVAGLRTELGDDAALLDSAVAVVAGRHAPPDQTLQDGDEVALLLPIAGG